MFTSFVTLWLWTEFGKRTSKDIDSVVNKHVSSIKESFQTLHKQTGQIVKRHNELEAMYEEQSREIGRLYQEIETLHSLAVSRDDKSAPQSKRRSAGL